MGGSDKTLIDSFVAGAAPVRRLWPTAARLAVWVAAWAAFALAVAASMDWAPLARLDSGRIAAEVIVALVAILLWGALALRAAVPGQTPRAGRVALALVVALIPLLFWHPAPGPEPFSNGVRCAVRTVALALLPGLAMLWAVRRGAPLAPRRAAALGGGTGLLSAYLLMRLLCSVDQPAHLFVWHVLPVVAGVALAAAAGGWWLARWRR
ncbi:MAG TPA: NrsF family protein [Candidatus Dormibacteraeota bacterium]|nr:NrsF family protein [Candidatus Dormibacteraeota bacterium]